MAGAGGGRPRRARSAGEARAGVVSSPPERRSARTSAPTAVSRSHGKPCLRHSKVAASPPPAPLVALKKPIALKKIVPRNRQVKEAAVTPRRSPRISLLEDKENASPAAAEGEPVGAEKGGEERDTVMARRVRRSYSRLELGSPSPATPEPSKRQTLFGFNALLLPDPGSGEEEEASSPGKAARKGPAVGAEASLEPETDLPGIAWDKGKRRKRKAPQFKKSELDEWMAQMNAEFEEAERFDLLVE